MSASQSRPKPKFKPSPTRWQTNQVTPCYLAYQQQKPPYHKATGKGFKPAFTKRAPGGPGKPSTCGQSFHCTCPRVQPTPVLLIEETILTPHRPTTTNKPIPRTRLFSPKPDLEELRPKKITVDDYSAKRTVDENGMKNYHYPDDFKPYALMKDASLFLIEKVTDTLNDAAQEIRTIDDAKANDLTKKAYDINKIADVVSTYEADLLEKRASQLARVQIQGVVSKLLQKYVAEGTVGPKNKDHYAVIRFLQKHFALDE